jgi:hypothetical protein
MAIPSKLVEINYIHNCWTEMLAAKIPFQVAIPFDFSYIFGLAIPFMSKLHLMAAMAIYFWNIVVSIILHQNCAVGKTETSKVL